MVALLAAGEGLLDPLLPPAPGPDADAAAAERLVECVAARAGAVLAEVDASLDLPPAARRAVLDAVRACAGGGG